ncbi:hypothetical protein [Burkholderia thailandensis]|uniref:hypothetical protein n=1 Tax=Burkholderia thailandensis TaxID=57975 RepID=UPI0012DA9801|nr:hypothetical protein [Burkholderia thailandensis]
MHVSRAGSTRRPASRSIGRPSLSCRARRCTPRDNIDEARCRIARDSPDRLEPDRQDGYSSRRSETRRSHDDREYDSRGMQARGHRVARAVSHRFVAGARDRHDNARRKSREGMNVARIGSAHSPNGRTQRMDGATAPER